MNQDLLIDADDLMQLARDTGLFTSLCTISAPDAGGRVPSGTYTPVTGLIDLPCMDAPASMLTNIAASETASVSAISSTGRRHVLLDRYYALPVPETNWGGLGWRATVDGVVFNIIGVEADSQRSQIRLSLDRVSV